jgi:hypothetical protein
MLTSTRSSAEQKSFQNHSQTIFIPRLIPTINHYQFSIKLFFHKSIFFEKQGIRLTHYCKPNCFSSHLSNQTWTFFLCRFAPYFSAKYAFYSIIIINFPLSLTPYPLPLSLIPYLFPLSLAHYPLPLILIIA